MNKLPSGFLKKAFAFCTVLGLFVILRAYIFSVLYYFDSTQEPLFFSEYILGHIFLGYWELIGLGLINVSIIYIIGFRAYNFQFGFFLALLYAISPWTAYVDILGGNNTYFLSWALAFVLSIILFKQNYEHRMLLLFFSLIGLTTASIFGLLILVILLFCFYLIKYLNQKQLIKIYSVVVISIFIVGCMLVNNLGTTKNLIKTKTEFFQDLGILNTVNQLRGETSSTGFSMLGKFVENKYLYFGEKLLLDFSMIFSPSLFFTPQFKLLDFSFSPPIYIGFVIPCIIGIILLSKQQRYLYSSIILIIGLSLPSVLGKNSPDLGKLILVAPIIYTYISLGLIKLLNNIKQPNHYRLSLIMIFLLVIQILVVIADISLRERVRFELFYNQFS